MAPDPMDTLHMHRSRQAPRNAAVNIMLVLAAAWPGCSLLRPALAPPLPAPGVVAVLRERAVRFAPSHPDVSRLLSADIALRLEVTGEDGTERLPSLGGTMALDTVRSGLWLRATKFTREVFWLKALEDRFALSVPATREIIIGGPAAYEKLSFAVRPAEIRSMLAGPDALGLDWPDTEMAVDADRYRFEVRVLGTPYRRVLVDRRRLVVTRIERFDSLGRRVLDVRLDRYGPVGDDLLPHRLTLERPRAGLKIDLRLDNLKFTEPSTAQARAFFDPDAFLPGGRPPPGWTVEDLDKQ